MNHKKRTVQNGILLYRLLNPTQGLQLSKNVSFGEGPIRTDTIFFFILYCVCMYTFTMESFWWHIFTKGILYILNPKIFFKASLTHRIDTEVFLSVTFFFFFNGLSYFPNQARLLTQLRVACFRKSANSLRESELVSRENLPGFTQYPPITLSFRFLQQDAASS